MSWWRGRLIAGAAVEGAGEGGPGAGREPLLQVLDDLAYDGPRRLLRRLRHRLVEREQGADEVDVRLHRLQHLRLQQQRGQSEPVDGVALHDLDDGGREVRPDVAEPARDGRRRRPEPRRTVLAPPARLSPFAVERGQRAVHRRVPPGERAPGAVRRVPAEHEPPAPQPLLGARRPRPPRVASASVVVIRVPRTRPGPAGITVTVAGRRPPCPWPCPCPSLAASLRRSASARAVRRSSSRHPHKVVVVGSRPTVAVQAQQQPHHRQHRVRALGVEVGGEAGYAGPGLPPCSPARPGPRRTSSPSVRRTPGSYAENVRRSSGSTSVNASAGTPVSQASTRPSSRSSCTSSIPPPEPPPTKPSIQAAASAGGVPGDSASPMSRAASSCSSSPSSSSSRRPAPGSHPARCPARRGRAAPSASGPVCRSGCRRSVPCAPPGGVAEQADRAVHRVHMAPHLLRPPSASSAAHAGGSPTKIRSARPAATSASAPGVGGRGRPRSAGSGPGRAAPGRGGRRPRRARPGRRAPASPRAGRRAVRPAGSARRAR